MTRLIWGNAGERLFELGVDRGVLYLADGLGVAWNGLTSVTEAYKGGEATSYYVDGIKYLTVIGKKEFGGSISALTYPDEFNEYDGWTDLENGLSIDEQNRKPFSFSYRTLIGNDLEGSDYGYKIHLVYNALAYPSDSVYSTAGSSTATTPFSWTFTTTPIQFVYKQERKNLSHLTIDSTKNSPTQMRFIEGYLYGTDTRPPMLPTLNQLFSWFNNPLSTFNVISNPETGLSPLVESDTVNGDLRGRITDGIYVSADYTRLFESPISGLSTWES